jgi:hypothetical protein
MVGLREAAPVRVNVGGRGRAGMVRLAAAGVALAVVAAWIWFTFLDGVPRWDLRVFLRAGADVLGGRNPYPALDSPFLYSGHAFVYPYAAALPFAPLALLSASVADVVYFVLSVGAVLLAVRLAGVTDLRCYLLALLAATTIRSLQVGSLNAFLLLGCVVAWRYRDRAAGVGAAVAAVVVTKLFLVPLTAWLVIARRWRAAAVAVGSIAVVLGVGWAFGPMSFGDYRTLLEILSHHETDQGWSLHRLAIGSGASPGVARLITVVVSAATLAVAWWWHRRRGGHEVTVFAACIAAALLASPIVWSHYLMVLLAPLLVARVRWYVLAGFAAVSWLIAPPNEVGPLGGWINELSNSMTRVCAVQLLIVGTVVVAAWTARRRAPARAA